MRSGGPAQCCIMQACPRLADVSVPSAACSSEEQSRFTPCKPAFFVAWHGDSEITPTRPWRVGVKSRYPLLLGLGLLRPCRRSLSFRALRHFSLSRPCASSLFRAPTPHPSLTSSSAVALSGVACGVWRVACGVWRVACGVRCEV